MAHAADHLLPDIAALVEGDAVQLIHGDVVREAVAAGKHMLALDCPVQLLRPAWARYAETMPAAVEG
jgi:hypothetical protein